VRGRRRESTTREVVLMGNVMRSWCVVGVVVRLLGVVRMVVW
jgi:hypothetical protein